MIHELKPIRTEVDYENALAEVEQLWGAARRRATVSMGWQR